ncbi:isochorismate synthase [Gemmatimonadetes bacterium T265]|nr:isochorismate synthase [Gemmatimonadetes bacterium T265]
MARRAPRGAADIVSAAPTQRPARPRAVDVLIDELLDRLAARVADAAERARERRGPVVVSVVASAPAVDPLDALDALARAAATDRIIAGELAAGRMYWTRPADAFALAGVGAAATLTPVGSDRFAVADRARIALLDGALVDDPSDGAPGAGPLFMGGFAFDPAGPHAAHWEGFPSARLTLPRVQLAAVDDAGWITATMVVGPDGEPDAPPAVVGRLVRQLLAPRGGPAAEDVTAAGDGPLTLTDVLPADAWRGLVRDAVSAIRADAFEKVVLARAVRAAAERPFAVTAALRQLRGAYPDCYVFGCWGADGAAFVGASPERLVRLDGREVRATSLAGSAPRGANPADDAANAAALLANAKDRAEHAIVRRALVGVLGELCDDVRAPPEPSLRTLANVHHLQTDVRARLRAGRSLLDLVARLHPTPAVGGAPREPARRFLAERESLDRGWYAAPIGWVGQGGGEFAVGLRSALVRGDAAWLFAGCGIVADSDPDEEYAESRTKLRAMERALAAAAADRRP